MVTYEIIDDTDTDDPSHWLEKQRKWAFQPDERVDISIRCDKFLYLEQHFEIWAQARDLILQPDSDTKKRGLILEGPSHSGKSSTINQFPLEYALNTPNADARRIRTYRIYGDNHSIKTQLADLGRFLNIPDIPLSEKRIYELKTGVLVRKVADKLRDTTDLLFIDEFERLYKHSPASKGSILEALHTLIDESGVPIIIAGLDGVSDLLSGLPDTYSWLEKTFTTRFGSIKMKPLSYGKEYLRLLMTLHNDCMLRPTKEPFFANQSLCKDILTQTGGLLGKIVVLIKECASSIYRNKKKSTSSSSEDITQELINQVVQHLDSRGWKLSNGHG